MSDDRRSDDPKRIEAIVTAALEIAPPDERSAYLDAACGDDSALRAWVEALIRARQQAAAEPPSTVPSVAPWAKAADAQPAASTADESTAAENGHAAEFSLEFLAPPTQPGSLGRLAHYDILEVLGQGGFGIVFKAFDAKLHRMVAIKVLAPQLAANSTARRRFVREAQAAAAVRHEHVVDIHAVDEQPVPFIVMEYVSGPSLHQKLDRSAPLELKEILRIGFQIASGLSAAHKQGLVHRDIKPGNILLENGIEQVKITDFGLARAVDDASITQSGVVAGTPMYMAPEQALGEPLDHRADLFSLGTVLYVMCTGRPPFRASGTIAILKRVCEDVPRPIREINPEIPEWLADIIARLHSKRPDERFQSAKEVADLLASYLSELQLHGHVVARRAGGVSPPVTSPNQTAASDNQGAGAPRSPKRWRRWAKVAILLAVIAIVAWRFGPSLALTARNKGRITVELDTPQAGYSLAARDGEQAAITGNGGEVLPGVYELRIYPPPGKELAGVSMLHQTMFTGHYEPNLRAPPKELYIGRGDRVTVSARFRDAADKVASPADEEWRPLFNRNDLTGWKTRPEEPGDWRVVEGKLTCSGPRSHLFTERGDFGDFHLRLEGRISGGANSGLLLRCEDGFSFDMTKVGGATDRLPRSVEVDIHGGDIGQEQPAGSAWRLADEPAMWKASAQRIRPQEWFTLEVLVEGKRLRVRIDGIQVVDVAEQELGLARGHLALQHLYPRGTVEFRKIEIRELPAAGPAPAIAPFEEQKAKARQEAWAKHLGLDVEITNSLGMKFRLIPPGEFQMGATDAEVDPLNPDNVLPEDWWFRRFIKDRLQSERPQHPVRLTQPFYLGAHEVTVAQFRQFVDAKKYQTDAERDARGGYGWRDGKWERAREFNWRNPGFSQTDEHALGNISWDDAIAFCRWLGERDKVVYRLPTEAEWEFACRAGTTTWYSSGERDESLQRVANLADAAHREQHPSFAWCRPWNDGYPFTAPVGRFQPNAFGLYDMHGNVWEWCADRFDTKYYGRSPEENPQGPPPDDGPYVFRGGGWDNYPGFCRSADRYSSHSPTLRTVWAGFRFVREIAPPAAGPPPTADTFEKQAKADQEASAKQLGVDVEITNSLGMKLRLIPPGEFSMGSPPEEIERASKALAAKNSHWASFIACEGPQQRVQIDQPYYLGTHEVTVGQFRKFVQAAKYETHAESGGEDAHVRHWNVRLGEEERKPEWNWSNLPFGQTDDHPVVGLTWTDAQAFCQWLKGEEGRTYVLPSEAQWEFACRAGNPGAWCFGDDSDLLPDYAWITYDSGTRPVGSTKKPNAFGLFDMHGNAHEYCLDNWIPHRAEPARETVEALKANPNRCVIRGGCWVTDEPMSRSAYRRWEHRTVAGSGHGFRVAIVGDLKPPAGAAPSGDSQSKAKD